MQAITNNLYILEASFGLKIGIMPFTMTLEMLASPSFWTKLPAFSHGVLSR